jgi:hypothetical protein
MSRYSEEQLKKKRANDAAWRSRNREHVRQYNREYAKTRRRNRNKPYDAWHRDNFRARKRGLELKATLKHYIDCYSSACIYCGVTPSNGVDHLIDMSQGGAHDDHNTAPSCWPCNKAKAEGRLTFPSVPAILHP